MDIKAETDIDWMKIEVDELPEQPQTSTGTLRDCWDYEVPLLTTEEIPKVVEDTTDTPTLTDLHICDICLGEFKDKFIFKEHIKSVHTEITWDFATTACTASDSKPDPIICNNLPNHCSPPNSNNGLPCDFSVSYYDVENPPADTENLNEDRNGQIYVLPNNSENARDGFEQVKGVMFENSCDDSASLENQEITHMDNGMDKIDSNIIISSGSKNENIVDGLDAGEKSYECAFCDYQFAYVSHLKRHMMKHTGEKPCRCTLCDFKSATNCELKKHMVTHTGDKPYLCTLCDYKCAQGSDLKRHMMKHTGDKPYKCTLCDYKCARKLDLNIHMMKHTGNMRHTCTLCDYKCSLTSNLKKHMVRHTGDRPYKCTLCDYKCARNSNLKTHMLIHTGEKPHKCTLCDYKCARNCELIQHMVKHTGEAL